MRNPLAPLFAFALVACATASEEAAEVAEPGPAGFSLSGLTYNNGSDSFSGLAETALIDMPSGAGANATYRGDYTAESLAGEDASGRAALALDFVAATADLSLSGDLSGTILGVISGTTVASVPSGGDAFAGQFYNRAGDPGAVVAGGFTREVSATDAGTFEGRFIVER
ncbi:MAG: hypothetical protein AAFR93_13405 [Pseudomonadota bacterium]